MTGVQTCALPISIIKGSALKALEKATSGASDAEILAAPECKCILDLMDAIDAYIPDPVREDDKPFLLPVGEIKCLSVLRKLVSKALMNLMTHFIHCA